MKSGPNQSSDHAELFAALCRAFQNDVSVEDSLNIARTHFDKSVKNENLQLVPLLRKQGSSGED